MKLLIISDGHGALDMLDRLEDIAKTVDMVLFGGDFSEFKKPETGLPFLQKLASLHDNVFSVIGNCDEIDLLDDLEKTGISIEGSLSYFNGLVLSGSGGGLAFTGTTPNERTDEDLVADLHLVAESISDESMQDGSPWNNLVIIAHNPPKDTSLDLVSGGIHAGSTLLRQFIETYKPLLVVSGHIHESKAIDSLGPTTLINPGALSQGQYALAEITGGRKEPFAIASIKLFSL